MRSLLVLACSIGLTLAIGCGKGYESRSAPAAGTGDPATIVQELGQTRSKGAADAAAELPPTGEEKAKEAESAPTADAATTDAAEKAAGETPPKKE
ncbi:MAG: hypothetical protein GXY83_11340 [Rhodopirellula sp.]|nr:hypothetical protein [Rhodopirellula sp.]